MNPAGYFGWAWSRRELLQQLAWRDLKAHRRQSLLGLGWVFLQPLGYLLILSLIFSIRFADSEGGLPYPLVLICGLVPWLFFAGALSAATTSVVAQSGLVTKVAFPRVYCPLAEIIAQLPALGAGVVILGGLCLYYGVPPTLDWLWAVPLLGLLAALALGLGLFLAAGNVYTRDVGGFLPFLLQLWLFATPIIYPLKMIYGALAAHPTLLLLYRLNPLIYIVEGFRSALLYQRAPGNGSLIAAGIAAGLLVAGFLVFTRLERNFADVV